ncbi:conserved hypothetical protein [Pediculus humanus corporis]|uniref:PDZ domain-containing protein 8 n=1 Tax=Pediculus humanus subsp. corporis TaxID=121224 RepID=E0VWX5_PEDHC|nr:uncharacterized protein Phum_PHUM491900 [Pediculus humanus corporis]EEB17881.1 conserved hypothetical protein [Pediculus humanus corporis]
MFISWILTVLCSICLGVLITLIFQYYVYIKYFQQQGATIPEKKIKLEPFQLPKVLLDVIHCNQLVTKESCVSLNLMLQFLFHELRDTEKIRLWFRKKLCIEFEELLSKSTIGKMVGNIKIVEIDLGSEFPVLNNISIQDVKVNKDYSHIDVLDLKLDVNYSGGFRLVVEANMLLGKAALISIQINELYGEGRLEFTRLPYSHWSFTFFNEPKIELHVESYFQGRPFQQITNFISSQIKKTLKKKHTLPNYKIRYKPFFTSSQNSTQPEQIPNGQLHMIIHKVTRLNEIAPEMSEVFCTSGIGRVPWIDIINYGKNNYYLIDIVITKSVFQTMGFVFKQEYLEDKNQNCILVEDLNQNIPSSREVGLKREDIIVFIDGKKITSINQVQKYIKSAAVQFTIRAERKIRDKVIENFNDNIESHSLPSSPLSLSLRRRKGSESDGCSINSTLSSSSNKSQMKRPASDIGKPSNSLIETINEEEAENILKLYKSKVLFNKQIIQFEEVVICPVKNDDRFININVKYNECNSNTDKLLGFVNIPLSEVLNAYDTLRCLKLKPPDSFSASNVRNHPLLSHNGFIPLLCYGDIILTLQFHPSPDVIGNVKSVPEIIEPSSVTPESETPSQDFEERKHDFVKTHFQTSTQCEFCGRKIWLKDAEKCKICGMTCHKKCVAKCKANKICVPRSDSTVGNIGENYNYEEDGVRASLTPEPGSSSRESTPQPTPTKKRLGNLLATVASRGLKRVGSANNLTLPGDASSNSQSRSLPPSPQQSPSPSRKSSLPLELSEEISELLQALMENGSDSGDMMDFAKETGKTLYEDLKLDERKDKINEMINKLNVAINAEADTRTTLVREEQVEKDQTNKAKIAFLIGKSDEKTQALAILMLHFCAGLQHIQDLEDQEKENEMAEEIKLPPTSSSSSSFGEIK